eukprot:CAMPEP_0206146320 /NCGR_PEP_ID=MMETSP1473-20131121/29996_1 /ASSEMBLY_ACC=CAM_ASM_001109 /TAXON_ID=1461547 /ORGANISM="Stichococcus sp, Strain RCC1054" /LENGTH=199 /DNA_ID=CAMNT_0053542827 /DNA_START=138 /DNA_END=734 /DNA_ORIENTATION=+
MAHAGKTFASIVVPAPEKQQRAPINCDVAIVGGGLAGLICAIALRKVLPKLEVKIFEQFPRFERAGAVIGVQPNGQRAVEAIRPDLLQSIIDGRMKVAKSIMYRDNGDVDTSPSYSDAETYGQAIMLGWWELHCLLAAQIPKHDIVLDSKFAGLEERSDSVKLQFKASSGGEVGREAIAKLVVGTDGAYSAVRRQCVDD